MERIINFSSKEMYAIIDDRGKQYKVKEGDVLKVPTIEAKEGEKVEFDKILLKEGEEGKVLLGKPYVEGSKVVAEVVAHGKYPKVIHFFYRRRKDSMKKKGHRQPYTEIKILEIK